jgi:hypothetical protein
MEFLKIENIKEAIEKSIQSATDHALNQIKDNMMKFLIYILKCLGTFVVETADITCPIICLVALAFYIGGNRKAGKYVSGSIITFVLSQAIRMVLRAA